MSRAVGTRGLVILVLAAALATPVSSRAGELLEAVEFTSTPSPIPGQVIVRTVPSRWDDRCIPVFWRVNDTHDPLANPPGGPVVTVAEAAGAIQRSLDTWNAIPTSYIEMHLAGTVSNSGFAGFDLVNEVTFRSAFPLNGGGITRLVRFHQDVVLADGDDLNGDGIPDVSAAIQTCQQVDRRTKFPAGFYKAGTIIDADVILEADRVRLTVRDEDLGVVGYDLQHLATHELGHALGLGHSLNFQRSDRDGRGAVMGAVYLNDPVEKLRHRVLDSDDIAWASYLYPAGTAGSGPAALKPGDIPFASRYGLITGTVHHGRRDVPVPGGLVLAVNQRNKELVASGDSGTILLSGDPATGQVRFLPPESGIVDGRFVIPVPAGTYSLYVKPPDPPDPASFVVNFTQRAGDAYGLLDFHEEGVNRGDAAVEFLPGRADTFEVHAGQVVDRIDAVTNRTIDVNNFGPLSFVSIAALEDPAGNIPTPFVAVRVPAARFAEVTGASGTPILAALFFTAPFDPSPVQRFPQAMLTTGAVHPDGTASVDLERPLARVRDLVSRDLDFTPVFFDDSIGLGRRVSDEISRGAIENLFLVLEIPPPPYPGPSAQPPLLGLSCHHQRETLSYYTLDGVTFIPLRFCEVLFSLIVAEPTDRPGAAPGGGHP
jgi:Matrixin